MHLQMLPSMHRGVGLRCVSFGYSQATFQLELLSHDQKPMYKGHTNLHFGQGHENHMQSYREEQGATRENYKSAAEGRHDVY